MQESNLQTSFIAKDILNNILDIDNFPNRIRYSEFKNDNELDDHWRIFKPGNFKDIDGDKGEINKIIEFKNQMYFFQDRGTGYQSIQERSMITDGTGAQLVLGVGDILGQHQYLSDNEGTKHQESVVKSNQSIYYYNTVNKSINIITGEDISSAKGLNKLFVTDINDEIYNKDYIFDEHDKTGVSSCYDPNNERVIFSIHGARKVIDIKINDTYVLNVGDVILFSDGYYETLVQGQYNTSNINEDYFRPISEIEAKSLTVTYNEKLQAFESLPDYYPGKYFLMDRRFVSLDPSNTKQMWQHGLIENTVFTVGNNNTPFSNYYGNQFSNELVTIVNPSPVFNSIFNNFSYYSNVEEKDQSIPSVVDSALDTVQVWNEYQNSGLKPLTVGGNISRRFRKWRITSPRDILNQKELSKSRIRSKSIFVRLSYVPGNTKLTLENIITKFTPVDNY